MFVLRNAWAALMRHKWRPILSVIITMVVAFGSIFGLCVQRAHSQATGSGYDSQKPTAMIEMTPQTQAKRNGADSKWTDNYLSMDDYNKYLAFINQQSQSSTAPQISSSTMNASIPVRQSKSFQAIPGTANQQSDKTGGELTIEGLYSVDAANTSDAGKFKIVKGKALNFQSAKADGAVISQQLAEKNKLKVGDKISVGDPTDTSKSYTFTVRGIYEYQHSADKATGDDAKLSKDNRENTIYVSYATYNTNKLDSTTAKGWSKSNINVIFTLASPSDFTKFVKAAKKEKLPAKYQVVSPSLEAYERTLLPLKSQSEFSKTALPVLWAVGGLLLLALVALSLIDRGDEIGNAMMVGVSKARLGWQYMLEAFFPVWLGLAIGILAGGFGSGPLGHAIIAGFKTAPNATILWKAGQWGLVASLILALVAMLRVALTPTACLFAPRQVPNKKVDQ